MRTEPLYMKDSYLRRCEAKVLEVERGRGRRAYVVLDRTVFHPLSGGQPSDEGFIASAGGRMEVRKALLLGGELKHWGVFAEGEIGEGDEVVCEIDWERRYTVMRLHTAGHILDYAVAKLFGRLVDTVEAFHGPPEAYLEYDVESPPDPAALEELAREVVEADLPVVVRFVKAEELPRYLYNAPNLQRLPTAEVYRVVEIPGVNAMPCTGTHVRRTGEVGGVKVLRVEKRLGYRVYYTVV
uniref:Alanyl-tRNA editing protein n=1 Tax=Thermofilum pendens TaxID=2269 RepID=A0A7J3X8T3_THEPE